MRFWQGKDIWAIGLMTVDSMQGGENAYAIVYVWILLCMYSTHESVSQARLCVEVKARADLDQDR